MKKSTIICVSTLLAILIFVGLLFGVAFCPRNQIVIVRGEDKLNYSNQAIIKTANIKKNQSIFLVDKEKAIKNIEQTYPNLKVIQIKTTSVNKLEIHVRARHEMFYIQLEENYYIMDEDLKIQSVYSSEEILELDKINENPLENLIQISDLKNISASSKICDFVGEGWQRKATQELFVGMVTSVTKTVEEEQIAFDRDDVKNTIKSVYFEEFKTFNKMIVKTSYGVKLDIENPIKDMQTKISTCFDCINTFIENEGGNHTDKEKSGTIQVYYDNQGKLQAQYISDSQE